MTPRRRARLRHVLAAIAALAVAVAVLALVPPLPARARTSQEVSVVLAYVSIVALLGALAVGPLRVLRHRPNPVSFDLRRDMGLTSAVTGVGHVVFSLQHHFNGVVRVYFLEGDRVLPRRDGFGVGVWLGVGATVVLIVLACTSNDAALRRLRRRWKAIQRMSYVLAVLAVAHTVVFWGLLDRRPAIWLPVALAVAGVVGLQLAGVATRRRAARSVDVVGQSAG